MHKTVSDSHDNETLLCNNHYDSDDNSSRTKPNKRHVSGSKQEERNQRLQRRSCKHIGSFVH